MCDRCLDRDDVIELVEAGDKRDPIEVAKKRLRCYYECVSKDMLLEDDDDDDEEWEPRY